MKRIRLDQLLVAKELVESREKAQRLIRAGQVLVADQVADKPGHRFSCDIQITLKEQERYVGRGGYELEAALKAFPVDVTGTVALDVGASTGGFTDCLLQHGARHVYAADVGRGQLHSRLAGDPRVAVMDRVNARHLEAAAFDEKPNLVVVDVSFISLQLLFPALKRICEPGSTWITLIKPQFEAGPQQVGRGGVVNSEKVRQEVIERIRLYGVNACGLDWGGVVASPLRGPAGNIEYLAYWRMP